MKLVGAVHGVVDGGLVQHLCLAVGEVLGHRHHPADVAAVELFGGGQVFGIGDGAVGLVAVQGGLRVGGELRPQFAAPSTTVASTPGSCRWSATPARRVAGRDLGAEHAAPPGLSQHVVGLDAQRGPDGVEFLDEQFRVQKSVGASQMGAAAAADLVVVHHGAAGLVGECGDVGDVVVRHPGSAVQDDQGQRRGGAGCRGVVIWTQVSCSRNGTMRVKRGMRLSMGR